MKRVLLMYIICLIVVRQLYGQDQVDLIGFETQAQSEVTRISFEGKLPIVLSAKSVLIFGGQFHQWFVPEDNLGIARSPFTTLKQKIGFVGWKQKLTPKSNLLILGIVRSSHLNFDCRSSSRFQYGGVFTMTKVVGDNLKLTLGSYLNTERYSLFWVPMLGLDWSINENWRIYGNLPINLTIQRLVGVRIRAGVYFKGTITSYYNENVTGPSYVDQSDNSLTLFGEFYMTKNLVLRPSFGLSLGRSYTLYDDSDKLDFRISAVKFGDARQAIYNYSVTGISPVVGLSMILRVPNPKD